MSDKKAILEIVFVLMPESMTIRVKSFERENLGALNSDKSYSFPSGAGEKVVIKNTDSLSDKLSLVDSLLNLRSGIFSKVYFGNTNSQKIDFEYIKGQLSKWVENNCFFGTKKPLPRLESVKSDYGQWKLTCETEKHTFFLTNSTKETLEKLIGKKLPVWKEHRFVGEWTSYLAINDTHKESGERFTTIDDMEIHKFKVFEQ